MSRIPDVARLGWSAFFTAQLSLDELALTFARVAAVHRTRIDVLTPEGPATLPLGHGHPAGDFAVGDWLLADGPRLVRRLDRRSLLARRAAGTGAARQLIAANVDTLFVVTSCNADFNPARIERYLALAAQAGTEAVLLLTKADLCDDPAHFVRLAQSLSRGLAAVPLDARDPDARALLSDWTGKGRTVALVGSSGVGKTTLSNALAARDDATQPVREDDAKGRHTTTARALVPIPDGGWLIDTPGMRELRLADVAEGIDEVFDEVTRIARGCRFGDCRHETEPGCAVQAAIAAGTLDPARLERWRKLRREDRHNSETLAESRARSRRFGREIRRALDLQDRLRGR